MGQKLRIVSYLAPNLFWFYQAVAKALERCLEIDMEIVQGALDPLDDPDLRGDRWDILFICGLPLMRFGQAAPHQINPLVAPVMQAERYGDRPVYFADVIVRADSPLHTWEDLAQSVFCYNDLGSNSGYNLVCYELLKRGKGRNFFRQTISSGAHERSLQWILTDFADCAAIDSTVLDQAIRDEPNLGEKLRIILSLGPSPIPPIAVSQRLGGELVHSIQNTLLQPDSILKKHMKQAGIQHFMPVNSSVYKPILDMYMAAFNIMQYL